MKIILIFFISIQASILVLANNPTVTKKPTTPDYCSKVDLRPQFGPVTNQDGTGWCYAYAAADLVSFKLKKPVSPVDIALQNHRYLDKSNQTAIDKAQLRGVNLGSGGFPDLSILTTQLEAKGFCPDDKINVNDLKDYELNDKLVLYNNLVRDMKSKSKFNNSDCEQMENLLGLFPGLSLNDVEDIARNESTANAASSLAQKACQPRIVPQGYLMPKNVRNKDSKKNTAKPLTRAQFNQIHRHLSPPKSAPAAITIRMEHFYDFGNGNSKHAIHAMTLVGRQRNPRTGKCEYIVRNSWGPECSASYKPSVRCESGVLFIPEEELRKATIAADTLAK